MPSSATLEVRSFLQKIREGFLILHSIGFEVCCQIQEASRSEDGESLAFESIASQFSTHFDALEQEFNKLNEKYFATHKHYYRIKQTEMFTETMKKGPSTEIFREELEAISEKMKTLTNHIVQFIPKKAKTKKKPKKYLLENEPEPGKEAGGQDDNSGDDDECSDGSETSLEAVIGEDEVPVNSPKLFITEFEQSTPVNVKRESAESLGLVLAAAERVVVKMEPRIKMERPSVSIKPEPLFLVPSIEEEHSTSMATDVDTDMDTSEQDLSVAMDAYGSLDIDHGPEDTVENTVEQLNISVTAEAPAGCSYYT